MFRATQNTPQQPFDMESGNLKDVMDHAAIGMAVIDDSKSVRYVNPAFCALLDYPADSHAEIGIDDISPADDVSSTCLEFQRLLAGKVETFRAECQYRRRDGSLVWVLATASNMGAALADAGRSIVLQLVDIDKQKKAEEALIYSEKRWSNALSAGGQGVWDHDRRTDLTFHSTTWHTMRGHAPGEGITNGPEEWLSRIHPDDRERIKATFKKQDHGDNGFDTLEYRERHKDGHYIWIYSRGRPVEWDENGEPLRTVGTDTDITERKEMEAQLAAEKERLRVTLQSIGEGVISTNANGEIILMNSTAEELTGFSAEDAIGQPICNIYHSRLEGEDEASPETCAVSRCITTGAEYRPDVYSLMIGKDGRKRYMRESASPVRDAEGKLIGAVMVFQDSTARRKMQQDLAYSATHDSLTRLPNRMAFDSKLEAIVANTSASKKTNALCLIDLDYFKQVNDNGGHAAGDALLKEVANRIKSACRHSDFAARIGGDEFTVILEDCDSDQAKNVAQKIVDSISSLQFVWNDTVFHVEASAGVSEINSENVSEGEDALYRRADTACYAAKANGRNCVAVA